MKDMKFPEISSLAIECLKDGRALLSVGGDKPNTMTIGWGSIGYFWGKPVLMVIVRPQRHTYPIIRALKEFTVSMSVDDSNKEMFRFAGRNSGAEYNKFEGHGITALPAREVNAPIVEECQLHFECRTLLEQDMTPECMDASVDKSAYAAHDYHRMFFGEIVACYRTDK